MVRASFQSLVRQVLPRHRMVAVGVSLSTLMVVVALLVAQSVFGWGHGTPGAKAAGGGGSGDCAGIPQGVCHFKGNTAEMNFAFTSPDGCIQTTGRLVVSEDVTTTPPDSRVTGESAFAFLDEFDACTQSYLLSVEGFASSVAFQATQVTHATLDATIESTDANNNPAPMTVHLTWQGIGGTTTSIIDEYFKSPTELMIFKNRGSTRTAIVTGTITVGTIVVAAPTTDGDAGGMSGDLSYGVQGSLQLSRS